MKRVTPAQIAKVIDKLNPDPLIVRFEQNLNTAEKVLNGASFNIVGKECGVTHSAVQQRFLVTMRKLTQVAIDNGKPIPTEVLNTTTTREHKEFWLDIIKLARKK